MDTLDEKVDAIFRILTRSEVRRNPPHDPDEMRQAIRHAMQNGHPLLLEGFWGGHKNTREGEADESEQRALDLLRKTSKRISPIHPVNIRLLFSDMHSRMLNAVPDEQIQRYRQSLEKMAGSDFEIVPLSALYPELFPEFKGNPNEMALAAIKKGHRKAGKMLAENPALKGIIQKAASHHHRVNAGWLKANMPQGVERVAAEAGQKYAALRLMESEAIAHHHTRTGQTPIHFVFGRPETQPLLPPGPTLYWYSERKGVGHTPWFGRRGR